MSELPPWNPNGIHESGCLLVLGCLTMFPGALIAAIGGAVHNKACIIVGVCLLTVGIVTMIFDVTWALDRSSREVAAAGARHERPH